MSKLYRHGGVGGDRGLFHDVHLPALSDASILSFQLEDVKARQAEQASLNSSLKLEIAGLAQSDAHAVIARPPKLGLTETLAGASARV